MARDDEETLPAMWLPLKEFPDVRASLLVPVPESAWGRVVPDEARGGFPFVIHEVFWITAPVFHLLRVDGFTIEQLSGGLDERTVVSYERISLEQVEDYSFDLASGDISGTVVLTGSGRRIDLPVPLLHSYLEGGPGGYGRV